MFLLRVYHQNAKLLTKQVPATVPHCPADVRSLMRHCLASSRRSADWTYMKHGTGRKLIMLTCTQLNKWSFVMQLADVRSHFCMNLTVAGGAQLTTSLKRCTTPCKPSMFEVSSASVTRRFSEAASRRACDLNHRAAKVKETSTDV